MGRAWQLAITASLKGFLKEGVVRQNFVIFLTILITSDVDIAR